MRRHQERVRSQKCYNREIEKQVDICGGHLKPVISIIKLTDGNKINNSSQQSLFDQAFLHIPILKILKNALQKIALFFFTTAETYQAARIFTWVEYNHSFTVLKAGKEPRSVFAVY